ncbi:MAG: hypothetical protein LBR26_09810 [Prevotella sp.]|jgi:hypothetical protein|nr:hypothetical protein [Prevotella sp.]
MKSRFYRMPKHDNAGIEEEFYGDYDSHNRKNDDFSDLAKPLYLDDDDDDYDEDYDEEEEC